jgi:hypothetical protein
VSRRPVAFAAAFLSALALLAGGTAAAPDVERIVAVGDVHGDFGQFVTTLRAAKVIDAAGDWTAGTTHLVQTGDVLDRGPDSRRSMDLLMKLEGQAEKAGGCVHALLGNHEALVLADKLHYMTSAELASFGGPEGLKKAMAPDGTYGRWIRQHDAILKLNDVLFVHGGLSPAWANRSLKAINDAIRTELGHGAGDDDDPLWYRGLAENRENTLEKELKPALEGLGASRIVVGHTVSKGGIGVRGGGLVILIDVGMSRVYGGPASCLLVEKGKYFAVHPEGRVPLPVATAKQAAPSRP